MLNTIRIAVAVAACLTFTGASKAQSCGSYYYQGTPCCAPQQICCDGHSVPCCGIPPGVCWGRQHCRPCCEVWIPCGDCGCGDGAVQETADYSSDEGLRYELNDLKRRVKEIENKLQMPTTSTTRSEPTTKEVARSHSGRYLIGRSQ